MADEEPLLPAAEDSAPPPPPPTPSWRIGAAFCHTHPRARPPRRATPFKPRPRRILGLCNNLPYVVMLSAARDLLEPRPGEERRNRSRHDCDPVGTGAVLLADVVPALGVKLLLPLVGPHLPDRCRVVGVALSLWGSISAVAAARGTLSSLGGIALGSAGVGLGEVTFLTLASSYSSSGLSYWSSGTGAAGLGGALGFWGLRALLPLPQALLPALALPPAMLLRPEPPLPPPDEGGGPRVGSWGVAKVLLAAFLLAAVAVNHLLPSLGVAAALAVGEGLVGGGAYGNAFLNLSDQVSPPQQPLAVAVVTLMAEVAIAVAGGVALGAHAAFCGQE
ncbi:PREDICTED: battenin [Pseudopodoces humilis]|uniref:battenin n=1 Tax=Pseudopodoces humilis TaxID=181119 RepID=UPI0006B77291|nr:PREDICTED: battenin [Pseudopodoces humilis]